MTPTSFQRAFCWGVEFLTQEFHSKYLSDPSASRNAAQSVFFVRIQVRPKKGNTPIETYEMGMGLEPKNPILGKGLDS